MKVCNNPNLAIPTYNIIAHRDIKVFNPCCSAVLLLLTEKQTNLGGDLRPGVVDCRTDGGDVTLGGHFIIMPVEQVRVWPCDATQP